MSATASSYSPPEQLVVDKLVMTNECGTFIHAGGDLTVGSVLLDPNLDADGDGLPNGWEQAHGLDPLSSIGNDGADGDPDGDGLSNLEEYQLGTDPMDRTSPYHITAIHRQGSDVLVTWMTVNGKTNVLQSARGTANGSYSNNFTDLSPQIIAPGLLLCSQHQLPRCRRRDEYPRSLLPRAGRCRSSQSPMQRYQWLLFDADGTLFDFDRAEGRALEQAFGLIGVTFDPGYLVTYQRINRALWQAVERGEIKPVIVKLKRFELLLDAIGIASSCG